MLTRADMMGSEEDGNANYIAFTNSLTEPGYKDQFCTCVLVKLFNSGESLVV